MKIEDIKSDPILRRELGRQSLYHFAKIYFPNLFRFKTPKFHRRWYRLFKFKHLVGKKGRRFIFLIFIGFRESAKTSLAKIKITRDICYKNKKLISFVSYDAEASGGALFDIATWLQTNPLLINDFGHLFDDPVKDSSKPDQKQIKNFVCSNGVRVMSTTISKTVRGKVHGFDRPDCYVLDDFENVKTKKSAVMTRRVIDFFKELIPGIAAGAEVIFLCNKISDVGSVQWLLDTAEGNSDFMVDEVAVVERGVSVWPEKFAITDDEAEEKNKEISDPEKRVRSLESLKRTMNADGRKSFEQEMLNQPEVDGDRFFDVEKVDARLSVLKSKVWQDTNPMGMMGGEEVPRRDFRKKSGDWFQWIENYDKTHDYAISADVAEGYGLDSSVIEVLDLTDGRQVKEYESNRCPPDILGQLMVGEGKISGFPIMAPERNSIGIATINEIKSLNYPSLLREKTIDKITDRPVFKYGWHTNSKTRPQMLFDLKRDFEAGLIEINSIQLLREMRSFTNSDITFKNFDAEVSNHFDRVIAMAIAWQLRNHRRVRGFL